MASCVGCKKRTTSFCYVHKASVCDDCTASKCAGTLPASSAVPCAPNDVLGNYFDWLADGDFTPARCNLCNRSIGPESSTLVRLVCKDLFHRECLRESLARSLTGPPALSPAHLKCPNCNLALVDPNTQPRTKLREAVAEFVAQVARGGGGGGGAAASSSSSGGPSTPSRSSNGRREDDRAASPASSAVGGAGDSRFSPQVRDLMSKAASARAALPAGAVLPSDALSASPASSTSVGLYPSAAASAASARVASPLSSASPAASTISASAPSSLAASAAAAAQAKADLESQVESDDDGLKGHKPSRLAGMRRALSRSRLIVMIVVTIAMLLMIFAYSRSMRGAVPAQETKLAASILSPEN